jgi:hypothetical protein
MSTAELCEACDTVFDKLADNHNGKYPFVSFLLLIVDVYNEIKFGYYTDVCSSALFVGKLLLPELFFP